LFGVTRIRAAIKSHFHEFHQIAPKCFNVVQSPKANSLEPESDALNL